MKIGDQNPKNGSQFGVQFLARFQNFILHKNPTIIANDSERVKSKKIKFKKGKIQDDCKKMECKKVKCMKIKCKGKCRKVKCREKVQCKVGCMQDLVQARSSPRLTGCLRPGGEFLDVFLDTFF